MPIDVIIPVYRDYQATVRCVESVLACPSDLMGNIIVVDDCSPEHDVSDYCASLENHDKVRLLINETNLGFVKSVNRGMRVNPDHDVILLNSDTEVVPGWIDRLSVVAGARDNIATVTPFSNNATICSYPYQGWSGAQWPGSLSLRELDRLVFRANRHAYIDIPTAVGFCMYIKRSALDDLGLFDEEAFGKGYGEENDFCRRAIARGWRNVLCTGLFIYHQGCVSFGETREALSAAAGAVIDERYPDYLPEVRRFISQDPVKPYRDAINYERASVADLYPIALLVGSDAGVAVTIRDLKTLGRAEGLVLFCETLEQRDRLLSLYRGRFEVICLPGLGLGGQVRQLMRARFGAVDHVQLYSGSRFPESHKPAILHLCHSWGGGIERWVKQYVQSDRRYEHYLLRSCGSHYAQGERLQLWSEGGNRLLAEWKLARPIEATDLSHPEYRAILDTAIAFCNIGRVMVSSLIGHAMEVLTSGLPTIWVAHDHYPWCPSIVQYFEGECSSCEAEKMERCLAQNEMDFLSRYFNVDQAMQLRDAFSNHLAQSRVRFVAPTRGVIERAGALLPDFDPDGCTLIPHGVDMPWDRPAISPESADNSRPRLAIIGRLASHKGLDLVRASLPALCERADVVLLGCGEHGEAFRNLPGLQLVSEYRLEELKELVESYNPVAALLTSIVPETFSYTLSELWSLGVPPIATDQGAFAERIAHGVNGLLFRPDPQALIETVLQLLDDPRLQTRIKAGVAVVELQTAESMVSHYEDLFLEIERKESVEESEPVQFRHFRVLAEGLVSSARTSAEESAVEVADLRQGLRQLQVENRKLQIAAKAGSGSDNEKNPGWLGYVNWIRQRMNKR